MNRPSPEESAKLVYIVILNYKGVEDTLACLDSLTALDYPNYHIVVVDNHSGDGSVERLMSSEFSFHLIEADDNLGYSGGNNLGIQYAMDHQADYIWLLNNDTTVDKAALTHLVNEASKTGGLVGSLILYPDRSYQQVGTKIDWSKGGTRGIPESELKDGMRLECLCGASMLIPTAAFRRVGLLDESYFLYFEDGEFTLRALANSFVATLALRSRVYHKEGASTGKKSLRTQYYYQRNRLRMLFTYAAASEKIKIMTYTFFRLARTFLKTLFWPSSDRQQSLRAQWLGVRDFMKGISGPCPHAL